MTTKAQKVAGYDTIRAELDLMQLYLHDTQMGVCPIIVRKGTIRANLYRATRRLRTHDEGYLRRFASRGASCLDW